MAKPTSRVLGLLQILQSAPGYGGADLARRIGVDRRTLRRYIAHLVEMGIPVESQRGRDGGYRLRPGYKLPPMIFRADEALALALGLRVAGEMGLSDLSPAIASTQAKLERVMPPNVRRRLGDIAETVSIAAQQSIGAETGEILAGLSAAARARQQVHLQYRGFTAGAADAVTARDVDVYGVAFRAGSWYAVGYCHLRQDLRTFRIDRVASIRALPRSFGRPEKFDVLDFLARSIASMPRAFAVEVVIDADLDSARRSIHRELGELSAQGRKTLLRMQADDLPWAARELARLPFTFRVRKPAALRTVIAKHASALMSCVQ